MRDAERRGSESCGPHLASVTQLRLARAVSIVGHPALFMPAAVALSSVQRGAPEAVVRAATAAAVSVAAIVCVISLWRARTGHWQHVDASVPAERLQLNLMLGVLLVGGALLALWLGVPSVVSGGLLACAAIVLGALATRRWMKLSLHVAFAAFAASLLWSLSWAFWPAAGLCAAVAWSRLVLRRHSRAEVWAGLLLGLVVGLGFDVLLRELR